MERFWEGYGKTAVLNSESRRSLAGSRHGTVWNWVEQKSIQTLLTNRERDRRLLADHTLSPVLDLRPVFRAVECRKPFLIAANTGISAHIDGSGRILQRGPRRKTAVIIAEVQLDNRESWYLDHGDWPAGMCLAICFVLAAIGGYDRWRWIFARSVVGKQDGQV